MCQPIIEPSQFAWGAISAGDWLSAIVNAVSVVAAIIIASLISPRLVKNQARRDQRERLLRVLLHTWPTPANPEYQSSITLIPLDFKGCKKVLAARQTYLNAVNQ